MLKQTLVVNRDYLIDKKETSLPDSLILLDYWITFSTSDMVYPHTMLQHIPAPGTSDREASQGSNCLTFDLKRQI